MLLHVHDAADGLSKFVKRQGGKQRDIKTVTEREQEHRNHAGACAFKWAATRALSTQPELLRWPDKAKCDALGRLRIRLPSGIFRTHMKRFSFVTTGQRSEKGRTNPASPQPVHLPSSSSPIDSPNSIPTGDSLPELEKSLPLGSRVSYDLFSASILHPVLFRQVPIEPERRAPRDAFLDLPILVVEYKKADEDRRKVTNQLRMHLVACVKFLAALGIVGFPVYGAQTDGSKVVFIAASQKNIESPVCLSLSALYALH